MSDNIEDKEKTPKTFWAWLVKICRDLQSVLAIIAILVSAFALLKPYIVGLNPKTHWGFTISNIKPTKGDPQHSPEDGFVTALANANSSALQLEGFVDGKMVVISCAAPAKRYEGHCSISFPVQAGKDWWIERESDDLGGTFTVSWTPLRSGLFVQ